jgi:hypothetical protein
VVDKEALGEVFLLVLRSSTVNNIPPLAPYVSTSTCCSYQKDEREKPRNRPIWDVLSEVGEYCIKSYFQLFHICIGLRTLYIACNAVHPKEVEDVSVVSDTCAAFKAGRTWCSSLLI